MTAPKTSDYFGVYTVGSIEVESEEVIQTFALSATGLHEQLLELGVSRMMIDSGAGKTFVPDTDSQLLEQKRPSNIRLTVAVGDTETRAVAHGKLPIWLLGTDDRSCW